MKSASPDRRAHQDRRSYNYLNYVAFIGFQGWIQLHRLCLAHQVVADILAAIPANEDPSQAIQTALGDAWKSFDSGIGPPPLILMNSTIVQPPFPSAALPGVKEALGCMVIGTVLATGIYGISILQAYLYFRNGAKDPIVMKSFVTLVFILDTVSMVLAVKGLYEYVVTDFGNPWLLLKVPPILAFENGITVLIGTLTQFFFAHRLWALSRGNMLLVSSIIILSLCACAPGMGISVNLYTHKDIFFLGSTETRILAGISNGLSVICDVVIAIALCYYLHSKRTGFKRTDFVIDGLILYAVNRGALTAVCQACHMITTVALPGRFIFIPFVRLEGKLYCNTLLATLNAREYLKGDGKHAMELGSRILKSMNTSSSSGPSESGSDSMPTIVIGVSTVKKVAHDVECTPIAKHDT